MAAKKGRHAPFQTRCAAAASSCCCFERSAKAFLSAAERQRGSLKSLARKVYSFSLRTACVSGAAASATLAGASRPRRSRRVGP